MSSAKSALIAQPSDQRERLAAAMVEVCETSFFAFTEPAPAHVAEAVGREEAWFQASVRFSGPLDGEVTVALPEGLAKEMFAAFLGFEDAAASNAAEMHDVMGEFANMVCGTWLTSLGGDTCFALAHPRVFLAGPPMLDAGGLLMSVNDRPAVVRAGLD